MKSQYSGLNIKATLQAKGFNIADEATKLFPDCDTDQKIALLKFLAEYTFPKAIASRETDFNQGPVIEIETDDLLQLVSETPEE
ncbi:MAG: hypothetical protein M3Q07_07345 [Pseudobdellovibrionaceae bacterium]|nr:hypothetical protein [Pseudobdellovibrionaceae bacterium]